jgi:threonine dehydratase
LRIYNKQPGFYEVLWWIRRVFIRHGCRITQVLKFIEKMEIFQNTGSFKERGAYVKMKSLSQEGLQKGVIAMSAGNHAQAVAFHAYKLGVSATIVMPLHTPNTKVSNTEKWGAEVILVGKTLDEARDVAYKLAEERGLTFIHTYDDPQIIAGQGTIGLEIVEAVPQLDVLIIPLGGGGLAAGITVAAKALKPALQIYGVEIEGYTSMRNKLYDLNEEQTMGPTLADGIAVKSPGELTSQILREHLEDILVVGEAAAEEAIDILMRKQNIVAEGAGAVGVAALLQNRELFKGKAVATVICGGNIDSRILSAIAIRGRIRDGRIAELRIEVNDVPGMLALVAQTMADHGANIIELKHQRLMHETPIKMANLDVTIETRNQAHIQDIVGKFEELGLKVGRLTDIES